MSEAKDSVVVLLLPLLRVRSKEGRVLLLLAEAGEENLSLASLGLGGRSGTGGRGRLVVLGKRELEDLAARVRDVARSGGVDLALDGLGGLAGRGLLVARGRGGEREGEGDDGGHFGGGGWV